ncbi:receptor [Branchiostoma belcheri]|nr:receptor [Branchiostoma belcheri]
MNRETRVRFRVVPGTCLNMRPDVVPLGKALYTNFLTPPRCEWTKKSTLMVIGVVVLFTLCWLPNHVINLWWHSSSDKRLTAAVYYSKVITNQGKDQEKLTEKHRRLWIFAISRGDTATENYIPRLWRVTIAKDSGQASPAWVRHNVAWVPTKKNLGRKKYRDWDESKEQKEGRGPNGRENATSGPRNSWVWWLDRAGLLTPKAARRHTMLLDIAYVIFPTPSRPHREEQQARVAVKPSTVFPVPTCRTSSFSSQVCSKKRFGGGRLESSFPKALHDLAYLLRVAEACARYGFQQVASPSTSEAGRNPRRVGQQQDQPGQGRVQQVLPAEGQVQPPAPSRRHTIPEQQPAGRAGPTTKASQRRSVAEKFSSSVGAWTASNGRRPAQAPARFAASSHH